MRHELVKRPRLKGRGRKRKSPLVVKLAVACFVLYLIGHGYGAQSDVSVSAPVSSISVGSN